MKWPEPPPSTFRQRIYDRGEYRIRQPSATCFHLEKKTAGQFWAHVGTADSLRRADGMRRRKQRS